MEQTIKALGGRKLVLAVVLLVAGIAVELLSTKGLTENLLYLLGMLYGSFTVGNGVEHVQISKRVAKQEKEVVTSNVSMTLPPPPEPPVIPDYSGELSLIQSQIEALQEAIANQTAGVTYVVQTLRDLQAKRG